MGRIHSNPLTLLKRIQKIEKDVQLLKREILNQHQPNRKPSKNSLFGSVKGGDITSEMVEEGKRSLFRDLKDHK